MSDCHEFERHAQAALRALGIDTEQAHAHVAADGPLAAANTWVALAVAGAVADAWPLTDPAFRRRRAREWLQAHHDDPAVQAHASPAAVLELGGPAPRHPLWPSFHDDEQRQWRSVLGRAASWSWVHVPHIVDGTNVVVTMTPGDGLLVLDDVDEPEGMGFVMRWSSTAGWRVADIRVAPTP